MSDTAAVLEDLAKHLDAKAEVKRLNPADPSAAQAYENAAALLRRRALSLPRTSALQPAAPSRSRATAAKPRAGR